jgi:hypothetical protein
MLFLPIYLNMKKLPYRLFLLAGTCFSIGALTLAVLPREGSTSGHSYLNGASTSHYETINLANAGWGVLAAGMIAATLFLIAGNMMIASYQQEGKGKKAETPDSVR